MSADSSGTLTISWSQMRAHEECRQRSHLLRSGKRAKVTNLRNYFHGMVVDATMRVWLANPDRAAGDMTVMIDELIDTTERDARESGDGIVRWKGIHDRAELRTFCIELVRRLEPILYARILPYTYHSAKRFKVPVVMPDLDGTPTTVLLSGEMDLLVCEPARLVIWDLKGTRDDQYWRKTLGQLFFYDLACLALYAQPSGLVGFIQPMCTTQILEFTVTDDDRRVMWTRIQRMAHDIWRGDIACKEGSSGCAYCDVKHACPRFTAGLET